LIFFEEVVDLPVELDGLIEDFISKSGEKERTVDSVKKQIRVILDEGNGKLWMVRSKGEAVGYFFAELVLAEYGSWLCLIHHVMVKKLTRSVLKDIDGTLEAWCREGGVGEMVFFTKRSSEALIRSAKNGWDIDSVFMKRKV